MAKNLYTYDEFLKQAADNGLLQSFSAADLKLAQRNPDAGMSLLTYKNDYRTATTDEARALANAGAEKVRSVYGGYTGGTDGTGFHLVGAEEGNGNYVNQYTPQQAALSDSLQRGFDADGAEAIWADQRKAYLREGQRAYEESLGQAAANTGGIASTAAITAAQQARNYYAAQASDKKAELYQQLYENYLAERDQTVDELLAYDQMNQTAAAQTQQVYENALTKWKAYGYVTADIAGTLNLPVGTAYSEQAYNTWYQTYQEMANGVYTGQIQKDTVNPAPEEETENPAAGDRPQNHGTVSRGSFGTDVKTLQTYLIHLGYHCGDQGADGVFGYDTRAAVRAFQQDYGLAVDGICGRKTWSALFHALDA